MGFHSVAFGIQICKHDLSLYDFLKLIASKVDLYYGDKYITNPSSEELDHYIDQNETEAYIEIVLYDDITFTGGEGETLRIDLDEDVLHNLYNLDLQYMEDNNIHIGQPHCCTTMLYLDCCDADSIDRVVSWESLNNLHKWTDILFTNGRLPESSQRSPQLSANCCS